MLVTALSPVIGYDKASKIAHYAMDAAAEIEADRLSPTVAYDEAATTATIKAVKDLLTALPAVAMKN